MYFKLFSKQMRNIFNTNFTSHNKTQIRFMKNLQSDIPSVSATVIRSKLRKLEVKYEEGYNNFMIGCQICTKQGESLEDKTKIFINKTTGAFTCESCFHTGNWLDMQTYLSAKNEKQKISKDVVILKELEKLNKYLKSVKGNTINMSSLNGDEYKEMLNKFNIHESIPQTLMVTLNIRLDITHSSLYVPLKNASHDLVGYKLLKVKCANHIVEPKLINTLSSGIVISKSISSRNAAILVTTIQDFLILCNAGISYHIICLPNGLNNLSQHILPCFEKYNKLILWFGYDLTALETARQFSKKLGEKRCFLIRDKQAPRADPSQDFKDVLSKAQPIWHKSITTFSNLREDVLADLQNIDKVQGIKWMRFPTLNKIIKGHRRGELTVFTGPTGSGKTTFISEYSLDLAMQGVTTLWGSFEIRNARLARTMLQQLAGIPLDENLDKFDHWADQFEQLPIYYMTFHGQQTIKLVMEAIEHAVYVHDISHVIIDNLQFMMGMSEDLKHLDRFWKQDLIIANFRTFATRRNCHVTLVIHPRKEREDEDLTMSSIFGGAKASQEADNIIIIQDKRLKSVRGRKYLQICKNRYSGDLGIMPLDFDKSTLSFMSRKKKSDTDPT